MIDYTGSPAYTGSSAYTGSPALYRKSRPYRKSRLHRKSRLIQEVPPTPEVPPIQEVPPTPEVPPLYQKPRPPVINHFDRWCSILTTVVLYFQCLKYSNEVPELYSQSWRDESVSDAADLSWINAHQLNHCHMSQVQTTLGMLNLTHTQYR